MPRAVRTTSVEEQIVGYFRTAHLQTAIAVLNIARAEVQSRMPKPAAHAAAPVPANGAPAKKRVRRTKAEMEAAKKLQGAFAAGARGNAHAEEAEE